MRLARVTGEPCTLMYGVGNLRLGGLFEKVELADDRTVVPLLIEGSTIKVTTQNRSRWSSLVICLGVGFHSHVIKDLLNQMRLAQVNSIWCRPRDLDAKVFIQFSLISNVK
jgi:hypothetical protein